MNLRRFLVEAATLVGLAVACAVVSNALADRERKLAIPGRYPNATKVTVRSEAPPLTAFEPEAATVPTVPRDPASGPALPGASAASPAASLQATPAAAGKPGQGPGTVLAGRPGGGTDSKASAAPAELLARFPAHGQPFVEISGEAAAWLHARGALFLDARRTKDYSQGHVGRARSFPVWEAEVVKERVESLVAEGRDLSLPVVLYCSGGDCEDSHLLAQTLFGAGFENLLVYRDGFPDWVKRGGAVRTGGPE